MRKLQYILPTILIILVLCACSSRNEVSKVNDNNPDNSLVNSRSDALNEDDDTKKAISRLEEILEAVGNQDSDAIYNMFSTNAQNESNNLVDGIDYLFSLIEGKVETWEKIAGNISETNDYGSQSKTYSYSFDVHTEKDQYVLCITECLVNSENSDNVGLYSIIAYKSVELGEISPFSGSGIYMPAQEDKKAVSTATP